MGLLYKTKVYSVGAMEYENGQGWRNYLESELSQLGIITFSPYNKPFLQSFSEDEETRKQLIKERESGDIEIVARHMRQVRAEDLRLCDLADFIIAYINPKTMSWGSAEEIYWSNRMKKPIFLAIEGGVRNCSLWLLGTLPLKYIYNSVEDIVKTIKKIDNEEVKIDSNRWRLLKPEFR